MEVCGHSTSAWSANASLGSGGGDQGSSGEAWPVGCCEKPPAVACVAVGPVFASVSPSFGWRAVAGVAAVADFAALTAAPDGWPGTA